MQGPSPRPRPSQGHDAVMWTGGGGGLGRREAGAAGHRIRQQGLWQRLHRCGHATTAHQRHQRRIGVAVLPRPGPLHAPPLGDGGLSRGGGGGHMPVRRGCSRRGRDRGPMADRPGAARQQGAGCGAADDVTTGAWRLTDEDWLAVGGPVHHPPGAVRETGLSLRLDKKSPAGLRYTGTSAEHPPPSVPRQTPTVECHPPSVNRILPPTTPGPSAAGKKEKENLASGRSAPPGNKAKAVLATAPGPATGPLKAIGASWRSLPGPIGCSCEAAGPGSGGGGTGANRRDLGGRRQRVQSCPCDARPRPDSPPQRMRTHTSVAHPQTHARAEVCRQRGCRPHCRT